ncbi:MAG: 4-hydroxy-tetrahydrodipicolinate reductase [Candidatus Parcubacteria bacterium]|nr:4-hydroxy-tetrahydrodipicolinate reductase [Candidatus Parcubacteria bacterium]
MGNPVCVCLVGALGRMAGEINEIIKDDKDLELEVAVDPDFDQGDVDLKIKRAINDLDHEHVAAIDVVINFTNPEATLLSAIWCAEHSIPLVTGTTGLNEYQKKELARLAKSRIPIVFDSNMSLGVNLIDALLPKIAATLTGFAIEMVEIHHDQKKDFPSGTALRFAQTLVKAKGGEIVFGRAKGKSDNRPINEVVVHAIRGGTVPGEHTIYFLGPDEMIEIHHRALSRKIFALGAIKAVKWIVHVAKPGLYTMNNVLGL